MDPSQPRAETSGSITMSPSLGWSSTATNTFSRPLDTTENFYRVVSETTTNNRDQWAITLSLRLAYPPSIEDLLPYLRRAWLVTRLLHPSLAGIATQTSSQPDTSSATRIVTVGPFDEDEWLNQTFFVHPRNYTGDALVRDAKYSELPTLHWLPGTCELCFRSSHWRIDGMGMFMLANSYLNSLATFLHLGLNTSLEDVAKQAPVARGSLTPSLDDALDSYKDEDSTPESVRVAADKLIAQYRKGIPSVGLPLTSDRAKASPKSTYRSSLNFESTTTARILDACKKRGFSVSAAIQSAVLRAAICYEQHPMAKSYASYFAIDLRRQLSAPWNTEEFAVGMFSSGLPLVVENIMDGPMTFDQVVAMVNAAYRQDRSRVHSDDHGNSVSQQQLVAPFIRRTIQLFSDPTLRDMPPITCPDVSHLGNIENVLKRKHICDISGGVVEVEDTWLMVEVYSPAAFFHQWTFRDCLTIQASVNEAFYDREFLKDFMSKVKDELLQGLQL
ncbi:hypothetical protein GGI42DRAFT_364403 [Trichoderma sp. SZMC 28013]